MNLFQIEGAMKTLLRSILGIYKEERRPFGKEFKKRIELLGVR
jgi:hypothetical protein